MAGGAAARPWVVLKPTADGSRCPGAQRPLADTGVSGLPAGPMSQSPFSLLQKALRPSLMPGFKIPQGKIHVQSVILADF